MKRLVTRVRTFVTVTLYPDPAVTFNKEGDFIGFIEKNIIGNE